MGLPLCEKCKVCMVPAAKPVGDKQLVHCTRCGETTIIDIAHKAPEDTKQLEDK